MIRRELLQTLHCPYCGSGLEVDRAVASSDDAIEFGIVACSCYRYAIAGGILVLRQMSTAINTVDHAVGLLESGDTGAALRFLIERSPVAPDRTGSQWLRDAVKRQIRRLIPGGDGDPAGRLLASSRATLEEAIRVLRPRSYGNYLLHRYANNSFLGAIPLLLLVKELRGAAPMVLDVNCGIGHASFLLQAAFPHLSVVATDHDFANLYLAHRYLAPKAACICLDAEAPMPFDDAYFDAAVCMDGLHYVRAKRALLGEFARMTKHDALWLFPHMHNAAAINVSPGVPLSREHYPRVFDGVPLRLLAESQVLSTFMREHALDLTTGAPEPEAGEPVLSIVVSRRKELWRRHDDFEPLLARMEIPLRVNPIYQATPIGDSVRLDMVWPAGNLERECETVKQFLPQTCWIKAGLWRRLQMGAVDPEDQAELDKLRKSFVLVPLPQAYA